jgi:hypothetical protein
MRQGNFSELLSTNLNGQSNLSAEFRRGAAISYVATVRTTFSARQINSVAQNILTLSGAEYERRKDSNNYIVNTPTHNNTIQWDQRLIEHQFEDQAYVRYSYVHQIACVAFRLAILSTAADMAGNTMLTWRKTLSAARRISSVQL